MIFTIIFCAWQTREYLDESLTPWIEARRQSLGGHTFRIVAVCVPFVGFDHSDAPDGTRDYLYGALERGEIDEVINGDLPRTEVVARGAALQWAIQHSEGDGMDEATWQWDADEVATLDEIQRMADFMAANPLVAWARTSYRNAVFAKDQFLAEPFTPARIHRLAVPGRSYRAHSFYDDNNVMYGGTITRDLKRDLEFSSVTIPSSVAFPRHYTWLNDQRSRKKCAYQLARWGLCSFRWDDATNGLQFNEGYYRERGLPLPEIVKES